jgi:hypothetical protein
MDVRSIPSLALLALSIASPVWCSAQQSTDYPTRSTTSDLAEKRYVAAGNRAYVVGAQDGTLPPIGWHISGTMGGVWSHPIKLLDSYTFLLGNSPLPPAEQFTSGPGFVKLNFPAAAGLQIARTEFSPDNLPVVLIGLEIKNISAQIASTTLAFQATSQILPAYPWSPPTTPPSSKLDQQDNVQFEPQFSGLVFSEPNKPWYALVAGRPSERGPADTVRFVGASGLGIVQDKKGATGELSWQLTIAPGSTVKIWFAVAGTHVHKGEAYGALFLGLANPDQLLSKKINERTEVLALTDAKIPDQTVQDAFTWAKLNLADMSRTVLDAEIRDTQEGTVYNPPVAEFGLLRGFGAGYPDYPWYFGTDGSYTVFPLTAAGQWDSAMSHLRIIRAVSQAVNGSTGKVLHEIVTDGSIYFGTNAQPGDTNETAEFATAVATLWRWSGNNRFRDENYDFIKAGLNYLTTSLDLNNDGWPEGAGMVEANGMGAEKLDVAVYTIRALNDLADMAVSKGDKATANWARTKANGLTAKFEHDWWDASAGTAGGLYADSLALNAPVATDPLAALGSDPITRLEQYFWINATPMETDFATVDHAATALLQLEGPLLTGARGFNQQGNGAPGGQQASALNTSVMAVAEANYGRTAEALTYVHFIASELDTEQPGALPELFDSPDYQYFQAFTGRAMVMQAWSSYGVEWPVIYHFLGIRPDVPNGKLTVVPDLPSTWPTLSVDNLRVGNGTIAVAAEQSGNRYSTKLTAPHGYQVQIGFALPATANVTSVTLNGNAITYQVNPTHRGREVIVTTNSGQPLEVVITTQ